MKCEMCESKELVHKKGKLLCKKCGHIQKEKPSQYADYPLSDSLGRYRKRVGY